MNASQPVPRAPRIETMIGGRRGEELLRHADGFRRRGARHYKSPPAAQGKAGRLLWVVAATLSACVLLGDPAVAAPPRSRHRPATVPRGTAPRPQWNDKVKALFFTDVRQALGDLESLASTPANMPLPSETTRDARPARESPGDSPSSEPGWASWLPAGALEDEVKAQSEELFAAVQTPAKFKSGGSQIARRSSSLLAVLFQGIARYPGEVRWRSQAADWRQRFAQVGFHAKAASDATFREARTAADALAELLRGESPESSSAPAHLAWPEISERPPLMERLEISQQERLQAWTADTRSFAQNRGAIQHEAGIVRLLAEVIQDPAYEYAAEPAYQASARELADAMQALTEAAQGRRLSDAQGAVARARKACDECHANFRG